MKTYTFYIGTAPEGEVISRTLELPAAWTLEDLHDAIQEAFGLDGKAGFSFYMSGEAWDESSEYTHLDELVDDADDELWDSDETDETAEDDVAALSEGADLDTEAAEDLLVGPDEADLENDESAGQPSAQDIRAMFAELKKNPELRAQITDQLADQLKLPRFMLDAVLSNADSLLALMPDNSLDDMLGQGLGELADDEGPLGDTRETRIEDVDMTTGKMFLYLYDFERERYFDVSLESVQEPDLPESEFPRLIESVGELPPVED